jgi:inorganic pyrophosphatase
VTKLVHICKYTDKRPSGPVKASFFFGFVCIFLGLLACAKKYDYHHLNTFDDDLINVVIEIPAGHDVPNEYDPVTKLFTVDSTKLFEGNGLPFPSNFGFIAHTAVDSAGSSMQCVLIDRMIAQGKVVKAVVLGGLTLEFSNDSKLVIFAVEGKGRAPAIGSFVEFMLEHDDLKYRLQENLIDYYGRGDLVTFNWSNETEALNLVAEHTLD